jgi:sugar/nucleoside kinase (ribokinase family)
MAVGTPPGVAATTNPGASNPAETALAASHLAIRTAIGTAIGTDVGTAIGTDI